MFLPNDQNPCRQQQHEATFIPKEYMQALLILNEKLEGKNVNWTIFGSLAERLQGIEVELDEIEIVCSTINAEKMYQIMQEFKPQPLNFQTYQLKRKTIINRKECPVYVRSYGFNFSLHGVPIKVQGNIRFKIDGHNWGGVFEFISQHIYVFGKDFAVMPLSVASEMYLFLGWRDRLEKIKQLTSNAEQ
ncbi:MAG: hypothetical protein NWF01_00490 [Candidatus Bathyarchaeota archaeon]|nr:hypothetical protein [Candidatus Bathyarchaeota archaeon]